jgi:hypothetical protein
MVLLHLVEETRRDLDGLASKPIRSIHSIRTRMKNLRAVMRLLKPCVPRPQRQEIMELAESVKDAFARQRDAHVTATLRAKLERNPPARPDRKKSSVSARLAGHAIAKCDHLHSLILRAPLGDLGWKQLSDAYVRSYRRGRKGMEKCSPRSKQEAFHAARQVVKELFYQSRVLQPLPGMRRRRRWADRLGDRLGKLNDLEMLETLAGKSARVSLVKRIARKRKMLRTLIFRLAARLFDEKPRAIAGDLERCLKFTPAVASRCARSA